MVNPADTAGAGASFPVPPIPPRLWLRLSFSIHAPLQLEFVPTQPNPSPATSGIGSIGVFRPENLTPVLPKFAPPAADVHWANLKSRLAPDVNRLFTATGKKSARGRRTGPCLNPSLTCSGSTRVDPDSQRLHLGVSMRFGLPWRVKGIRHEARETAEAAARRAGLPLNEWLNTIILQQASGQEFKPQPHVDDRGDDFAKVQLRLDDLARRIDHVARKGPAAYAPKRDRHD